MLEKLPDELLRQILDNIYDIRTRLNLELVSKDMKRKVRDMNWANVDSIAIDSYTHFRPEMIPSLAANFLTDTTFMYLEAVPSSRFSGINDFQHFLCERKVRPAKIRKNKFHIACASIFSRSKFGVSHLFWIKPVLFDPGLEANPLWPHLTGQLQGLHVRIVRNDIPDSLLYVEVQVLSTLLHPTLENLELVLNSHSELHPVLQNLDGCRRLRRLEITTLCERISYRGCSVCTRKLHSVLKANRGHLKTLSFLSYSIRSSPEEIPALKRLKTLRELTAFNSSLPNLFQLDTPNSISNALKHLTQLRIQYTAEYETFLVTMANILEICPKLDEFHVCSSEDNINVMRTKPLYYKDSAHPLAALIIRFFQEQFRRASFEETPTTARSLKIIWCVRCTRDILLSNLKRLLPTLGRNSSTNWRFRPNAPFVDPHSACFQRSQRSGLKVSFNHFSVYAGILESQ